MINSLLPLHNSINDKQPASSPQQYQCNTSCLLPPQYQRHTACILSTTVSVLHSLHPLHHTIRARQPASSPQQYPCNIACFLYTQQYPCYTACFFPPQYQYPASSVACFLSITVSVQYSLLPLHHSIRATQQ